MPVVNPITVQLPANLPTDWTPGQTVSPDGPASGQEEQYGYNYLMTQVNAAQTAAAELGEAFPNLAGVDDLGGFFEMDTSIPAEDRLPDALYGQILVDFSGGVSGG